MVPRSRRASERASERDPKSPPSIAHKQTTMRPATRARVNSLLSLSNESVRTGRIRGTLDVAATTALARATPHRPVSTAPFSPDASPRYATRTNRLDKPIARPAIGRPTPSPRHASTSANPTSDALPLVHAAPDSVEVTPTGPMELYRNLVSRGVLSYDEGQLIAVRKLQEVYERLENYTPVAEVVGANVLKASEIRLNEGGGVWSTVLPDSSSASLERTPEPASDDDEIKTPPGLFLYGPVGTGKSMLLNLLHDSLPTPRKRRVHFHAFMRSLYSQMHLIRTRGHPLLNESEASVLQIIAIELVEKSPVLMLDEFQAPDPATTTLLTSLLSEFTRLGGIIFATSNKKPAELGSIGKNLGRLVSDRMEGFEVSGRDWRGILAELSEEEMGQISGELGVRKRYWVRGEEGWEEGWNAVLGSVFGEQGKEQRGLLHSIPWDWETHDSFYSFLVDCFGSLRCGSVV